MAERSRYPCPAARPPVKYGPLELSSRFLLSPLAGYTNLPFRRIVREIGGVGLATTDLVNARALLAGSRKSLRLIETCPQDRPFAVQIFGREPAELCEAARLLEARGVDSIDINMGCPVDRVANRGAGAGMMCRADTVDLVRRVVESVRVPVTVKMRLGWDETQITAPRFAREFAQAGVAAVAVHGRTREQGFRGEVDRAGIRRVVEAVERIPVIGNGDVRTVPDAARMLEETGCHGVSIGRGALANPWIFRQLAQWEQTGEYDPPGSFEDRLQLMLRQFRYLEELESTVRGPGLHASPVSDGGTEAPPAATESAIIGFRKMGHWYLKAMRVRSGLRNRFQLAKTRDEFDAAIAAIAEAGPADGTRTGVLRAMHVPVPSGPVERW